MSTTTGRNGNVADVARDVRRLGGVVGSFVDRVAERTGLATGDVQSLVFLAETGPLPSSRLAELAALSAGATTRMIDRLEQAGYVRRVPDPVDRRRVLVEPVAERMAEIGVLHEPLRRAGRDLVAGFDESQLDAVARFLETSLELHRTEASRLRQSDPVEGHTGGGFAAPLAGVEHGRLVFLSGAPRMTVRGEPGLKELYRASFAGPVPKMRVRGGVVTVAYPHFGWFDWRTQIAGQTLDVSAHWQKDHGEILLNADVPWAIELRGGVSSWSADLRSLRLESFELRGGASKLDMILGKPAGVVPIQVTGGMNRVSIERPPGTAMGLEISGGVSEAVLDGEAFKGHGRLSIQTPGAQSSPDRYEVSVSGGVTRMSVSTKAAR